MPRFPAAALSTVVPLVLLIAGCSTTIAGYARPTSAAGPPAQAGSAEPFVTSACDLLTPEQVTRATGRTGIEETESGLGATTSFGGCFFQDDTGEIFMIVSFARGFVETSGQEVTELLADGVGPPEPLPGIGAGAAYVLQANGEGLVVVGVERGDEVIGVSVRGAPPRDQLEALARDMAAR